MSVDQECLLKTTIRWIMRCDLQEVLAIEAASFEFPWSEDDFIHCLRQRNCFGIIAEYDGRVIGFVIYDLYKNRINVLNFATAPEMRRRGVGTQMFEKILARLLPNEKKGILFLVRETNDSAVPFLERNSCVNISVFLDQPDNPPGKKTPGSACPVCYMGYTIN